MERTKGTILSLVVELLKAKFKVYFVVVTEEDPSLGGTCSDDTRRSDHQSVFSRQSQDLTGPCNIPDVETLNSSIIRKLHLKEMMF